MHSFIQEIRDVLSFQQDIHGPWFPVDPPPAEPVPGSTNEINVDLSDVDPASPAPSLSEPLTTESMPTVDLFGQTLDPAKDPSLSPYERVMATIPEDSPLRTLHTLEEMGAYLKNTILIPIDETRLNPVLGVGKPDADLLIIGEAPGAEEDKTGEPFTGRAGQLLNKILAAISFAREDVYISNILKSRPPNNRDPEPYEVEAHMPILMRQIALIQPKLILCVGKTAGNSLLGRRSSLGSLRGKFYDFYGIPTLVTYHPAALLRNPQWKRPTWEDVKLLRTKYDELIKQAS